MTTETVSAIVPTFTNGAGEQIMPLQPAPIQVSILRPDYVYNYTLATGQGVKYVGRNSTSHRGEMRPEIFTTKNLVDLIVALEAAFKEANYELKFIPEPITEGGLLVDWPGRRPGEYKSIRFGYTLMSHSWPLVSPNTRWEWENSPPQKLFTIPLVMALGFKALYGAPCWRVKDMSVINHTFRHMGWKCFCRWPKKTDLVSSSNPDYGRANPTSHLSWYLNAPGIQERLWATKYAGEDILSAIGGQLVIPPPPVATPALPDLNDFETNKHQTSQTQFIDPKSFQALSSIYSTSTVPDTLMTEAIPTIARNDETTFLPPLSSLLAGDVEDKAFAEVAK